MLERTRDGACVFLTLDPHCSGLAQAPVVTVTRGGA